jgi:hypothetical protein
MLEVADETQRPHPIVCSTLQESCCVLFHYVLFFSDCFAGHRHELTHPSRAQPLWLRTDERTADLLPTTGSSTAVRIAIRPASLTGGPSLLLGNFESQDVDSSTLQMSCASGLLTLSCELQLYIAQCLVGDVRRDSSDDRTVCSLSSLALTCTQTASIARETLCVAPVVRSSKADVLISFLFKYPDLREKIECLTIETKETRTGNAYPAPIAHLDPVVLSQTKRHVRELRIRKYDQDCMIASLKSSRFEDHSILLGLLLTMLPRLSRLYLGGSILLNFPFLRNVVPNEPSDTDWPKPDWAAGPDLTWISRLIAPRLTALELPIDLRRNREEHIWTPLSVSQLPGFFPRLQWLSIPHMAATEITRTSAADVIPASLHTLILTDVRCNCFEQFSRGLFCADSSASRFLGLKKIALYHRYPSPGTDREIVSKLEDAGIEVLECIPDCCLRSGDEFYHPWKYSPDEIGRLENGRHEKYSTAWDRAALQCDSDDE